jgi:hypothetical protein
MSRYEHLLEGKNPPCSFFRMAHLVHVKREVNLAAHGLVREVVTHIVGSIWMEEIPPQIYDIIIRKRVVLML